MTDQIYLSLGSNMGDSRAYLKEAIDSLQAQPEIEVQAQASLYRTSPVGGVVQDDFVNTAVRLETSLSPEELLEVCQKIEKDLNRVCLVHWGPRTIDLDIVFFGNEVINEAHLIIPHKEAFNRLFVLQPIQEIFTGPEARAQAIRSAIETLQITEQKIERIEE